MARTSAPESETVSEDRLKDLSVGNPKLARSWVMFEEGKMLADEILHLRSEVARLSKNEPEK